MPTNLYRNKYRIPSTRLSSWDYRTPGGYFVTLCTKHRECFFGNLVDGKMQLSTIGHVARHCWQEIPKHCKNVRIDEYVVMPNHVHGILMIERRLGGDNGCPSDKRRHIDNGYHPDKRRRMVETFHGTSLPCDGRRDGYTNGHHDGYPDGNHQLRQKFSSPNRSLSKTMSAISPKRGSLGVIVRSYKSSVTRYCRQNGYSCFAWQPRFYEHIIRANGSIEYIRRYIVNNPKNWQRDRNNIRKLSPPTSSSTPPSSW